MVLLTVLNSGPAELPLAVVPILVGPLQALLALLPAILVGLGSALAAAFKPRTILLLLRLLWRQKVVVVALAAVTTAGIVLIPRWRGEPVMDAAAFDTDRSYAAFRGGPDRRGWIPGWPDPVLDVRHWAVTEPHRTFYSSPAVVGDYVFTVSAHVTPFNITGSGRIQCFDAETGRQIWTDRIRDLRATFSSPAVYGNYLVVGEGLHFVKDARIICLDSRTGETRWTYRTGCHVESSPVIADGRVYVGAGSDGIYCLALEPDENGDPVLLWHRPGEIYVDAESSPVVQDGLVIMGLGFHGNAVVALDAVTGEERWRRDTPYPVFASPTWHGDRLFIGMGNADFVNAAEQIWANESARLRTEEGWTDEQIEAIADRWQPGGAVWSLDPKDGSVQWKFPTPRAVIGSVVANDDHVFFGARDGTLYKLDRHAGQPEASWNALAPLLASPALGEDHIYVTSNAGILFALRQDTLEPVMQSLLWDVPPGPTDYFLSSPTVSHGRVFVGTPAIGLLALGEPGQPPPPVWKGPHGGPGATGVSDTTALPPRMGVAALYPPDGETPGLTVTAPMALGDATAFIPYRRIDNSAGILALSLADGGDSALARLWDTPLPAAPVQSPVLDDTTLYVLTPTDSGSELHVIDAVTGAIRHTRGFPAGTGDLLLTDRHLLIRETPDRLAALTLNADHDVPPDVAWRFSGTVTGSPHAAGPRVALISTEPDVLTLLDAGTGAPLWRVPIANPTGAGPVMRGTRIWLATATGVESRDVLDGSLDWHAPVGPVTEPLILSGRTLLARSADGPWLVLDAGTGSRRGQWDAGELRPMASGDGIYSVGSRGFVRGSLAQPAARPDVWMRWNAREHGAITRAPLMHEGRLVLATERGVVLATGVELNP